MRPLGLRTRLLAVSLGPALLVLTLGGFLLFRLARGVLEEQLGASLSTVAAATAAQLKVERLEALTPEDAEGEGSRTWRSLHAQLSEVQQAAGVRRVLAFDREQKAWLDVGGGLPPRAEVPELLRDKAELARVFAGERVASQVLFEGRDGQLYKSGYAPLKRADGSVAGAVAVEGSAAFFGPLTSLANAFATLLLATMLALAAAALFSARTLSRPLERLVEGALRIGRGDLSTKVPEEPTREIGILSRELEAMRQALESRDRQLKLMLGGVAHEVKNPLGGIELFSGLLDEELAGASPDPAEARSHVARIRRELDYLKRIVEDFLAFAREQKLASATFDAKGWVEGAAAHLAGEAQGKGVTLTSEAAPAPLFGDESLLTSALVNLVKNAVQASATGKPVRVVGRVEGARYAVEVLDEGPGVPADAQARVFEPFFTTREKGTGLGLPLARKLVEAHGGTLTLRSQPGATCFRLEVPLAKA